MSPLGSAKPHKDIRSADGQMKLTRHDKAAWDARLRTARAQRIAEATRRGMLRLINVLIHESENLHLDLELRAVAEELRRAG